MHTAPRYLLVVLAVVISGHYLLSFTTTSYPRFLSSASSHAVNPNAKNTVPMEYYYSQVINSTHTLELANRKRANATFVILARNSDLDSTVRSVREMEDRCNRRHGYPFVLLNDEPFTEEFKRRLNAVASDEVFYGQVPREHWVQPDWVDEDRATKGREQLVADNVIYGGSVSYRNMCRFNWGCVSPSLATRFCLGGVLWTLGGRGLGFVLGLLGGRGCVGSTVGQRAKAGEQGLIPPCAVARALYAALRVQATTHPFPASASVRAQMHIGPRRLRGRPHLLVRTCATERSSARTCSCSYACLWRLGRRVSGARAMGEDLHPARARG
ncbi:glycolipid 2-alpha-mannosyltransferase-domain-containing protein [Mycena metata]|uniref:Glycolipid 2-alpha-mannosyltransferase-domain-containing protein n=1 Tax=Mycena metata TaxID=1033252 RepID=A0AAD7IDV9_9AGAR|nr:glycolipid 2-alpha-mannosyltransferase-domain-containing protein [Mycena metata]